MSLKETLANDLKTAMKEKDRIRKDTIQMVRAAILQTEKDQKVTLNDEGVIEAIARELKKRRDSLKEIEKSGRQDLVENIHREIKILTDYLPEQLSKEALEEIVRCAIDEAGATTIRDMGKVMKIIIPKIKGKADGSQVNALVKKILES